MKTGGFQIGLLLWTAVLLSCRAGAVIATHGDIVQRIERGERFLTNLFDAQLQLLPEYRGSTTYWLFHDNYLAAHVLATMRPDLSRRLRPRWRSLVGQCRLSLNQQ